ncbi:MAG TPA: ATP-dependent DNA helicase [Aeromonadales bacterium]|nr:ATP-dependent DNA helicase [Aeromonadales bacterium]
MTLTETQTIESEWMLSAQGPFAQQLKNYQPRQVQQQMASAVENCIATQGRLAVEAGTGTGKTLAYLVPSLLSGKKILVSTGTKTLQDQLFEKDLPLVVDALGVSTKLALLKGRANYLCINRMEMTLMQGLLSSKALVSQLQQVKRWSGETKTGDLADGSGLAEDSQLIPSITSSVDNCLGSQCPDYDDCFVVKARKKAMDADLIVINHYLFFADLSLKEDGFGELLPEVDVLVFDESHQLAEIARNFLGERFSSRQVLDLTRDIKAEYLQNLQDCKELDELSSELEKQMQDWRLAFGHEATLKENWRKWQHKPGIITIIDEVLDTFISLNTILEAQQSRSPAIELCYNRALILSAMIARLKKSTQKKTVASVQWIETFSKTFAISQTPLEISQDLKSLMQRHEESAWIFTSATLSIAGNLNHFLDTFSLSEHDVKTQAMILHSPFDYENNTLFYLPRFLPEPNLKDATEQVMQLIMPLINMSQGNAFVLLTSYRALNIARDILQQLDYPILVQGDMARNDLLNQFRQKKNSVLIATGSFWEGVDVAGDHLSLVIIDRLPFSSPSDPVVQARSEYLRKQGKDPFQVFQIPDAVISLKQGAGRLIRTETDKGVLVVLDPRIISRRYGEDFISSLPAYKRTREIDKVRSFFQNLSTESEG